VAYRQQCGSVDNHVSLLFVLEKVAGRVVLLLRPDTAGWSLS